MAVRWYAVALGSWTPDGAVYDGGVAGRTLARLLRSKDVSLASASRRIAEGLPYRLFSELSRRLRLTQAEFAALLRMSESTLYRRKAAGRFEPTESDRLWRYLTLYARALEVLEGEDAAAEWLNAAAAGLGGLTPLAVATDGPGYARALAMLGRIEHGVFG